MKIGLFSVLFNDKPLEEVADYAAGLGYEVFELAAWRGSNHFDTDRAHEDKQYAQGVKKALADRGIEISALSNHLFSQMVLPFQDASPRRVGGHLRQGGDGQARHRAHHQDGRGRLRARDQDGVRLLRLDRVGELVHLAAAAPRDLRRGLGALRRALEPDPRPLQGARRPVRARGAPDRDRLQRLHGARGGQAPRPRRLGLQLRSEPHGVADDRPGRLHQGVRRPDPPRPRQGLGAPEGHPPHRRRHGHRARGSARTARPATAYRAGATSSGGGSSPRCSRSATTSCSRSSTRIRSCPRRTAASSASSTSSR